MEEILITLILFIIPSFFVYFINETNRGKGVYILRLPLYYFFGNSILILFLRILVYKYIDEVLIRILLLNVVFFISYSFYYFAKKVGKNTNFKNSFSNGVREVIQESDLKGEIQDVMIPEVCPHCKNRNVRRIRLCEWCGNQIF